MEEAHLKYLQASGITPEIINETARRLGRGEQLRDIAVDLKINTPTLSLAFQLATNNKQVEVKRKIGFSPEIADEANEKTSDDTTVNITDTLNASRHLPVKTIGEKTGKNITGLKRDPVSQEILDETVRRLELGENFTVIARLLGIKHSRLKADLQEKTGKGILEYKKKRKPLSQDMVNLIMLRLIEGESFIDIAKTYDIDTNALHRKFMLQTGRTAYQVKKIHADKEK